MFENFTTDSAQKCGTKMNEVIERRSKNWAVTLLRSQDDNEVDI